MSTKFTELSKEIDEVDRECMNYLSNFTPESEVALTKDSMLLVISKLIKLWNGWLAECGHDGQPFQLLERDINRPPVWIDPATGAWVVMAVQPGQPPRPTALTLEQLNQFNINHIDLVKGIRRRLHLMTIQAASTQRPAKA